MRNYMKVWRGFVRLVQAVVLFACALTATSAYSASKTILVVGDSLSAEYGLVRGTGWVPLLEKRLHQEKIDAAVVNASISGDTTSGGKARLPALLDKHHPDVVILELGGNDALRGLQLPATEANLREMIASSKKRHAGVLLVGMQIPPNYGADYANRFSAIYPKLAKETRSEIVPFLLAGVAERQDLFQADRIHPVAAAQSILLDNVWPHLKPLLKK
jgi:acyl-CoA thioesterase I